TGRRASAPDSRNRWARRAAATLNSSTPPGKSSPSSPAVSSSWTRRSSPRSAGGSAAPRHERSTRRRHGRRRDLPWRPERASAVGLRRRRVLRREGAAARSLVAAACRGLHAWTARAGGRTIDAACASSLYAIKLAIDDLLEGRADAMLAGGMARPDPLYTQMGFSQLLAVSPSGACRPFDAAADGLVVGEGACFVL